MKRIVTIYGLIAGGIVSLVLIIIALLSDEGQFNGSMLLGYASMLVAFSLIFIGIKKYRDEQQNGRITFGTGFLTGIYISLIASTMYVAVWLVEYYFFYPDFMEQYTASMMDQIRKSGASQTEIDSTAAEMKRYAEMYKNPLMVIVMTYAEILPVGVVISLISALVLRKNGPGRR